MYIDQSTMPVPGIPVSILDQSWISLSPILRAGKDEEGARDGYTPSATASPHDTSNGFG